MNGANDRNQQQRWRWAAAVAKPGSSWGVPQPSGCKTTTFFHSLCADGGISNGSCCHLIHTCSGWMTMATFFNSTGGTSSSSMSFTAVFLSSKFHESPHQREAAGA